MEDKIQKKLKRQLRVRGRLKENTQRPRLSVSRSNKFIFAQLIDDSKGETIIGVSEKSLKTAGTKSEKAKALGLMLAEKIKAKKISKIVFDRGSYSYHGRVKNVADGLREGGIDF
jgi:large subunit ribosomal protein L18